MLVTIIVALLFPNSRLVLCQIFSYYFRKIRNRPKIFLRSFENVAPMFPANLLTCAKHPSYSQTIIWQLILTKQNIATKLNQLDSTITGTRNEWSTSCNNARQIYPLATPIMHPDSLLRLWYYTVFRKKHPLTFSFISPWTMCGFKQKLQWIYLRNGRFWQCRN